MTVDTRRRAEAVIAVIHTTVAPKELEDQSRLIDRLHRHLAGHAGGVHIAARVYSCGSSRKTTSAIQRGAYHRRLGTSMRPAGHAPCHTIEAPMSTLVRLMRPDEARRFLEVHHESIRGLA